MILNGGIGRVSRRRRRFTLIELLVVVSVIAILMSMLLPALGNARATGKRMLCASNMRQCGILFMNYCGENNEQTPSCGQHWDLCSGYPFNYGSNGEIPTTWKRRITGPFLCPGNELRSDCDIYRESYPLTVSWLGGVINNGSADGILRCRKLTAIVDGSVIVLDGRVAFLWMHGSLRLGGSYVVSGLVNYANSYFANAIDSVGWYGAPAYDHHRGFANFLFKDGHVMAYKAGTQFNDSWLPK